MNSQTARPREARRSEEQKQKGRGCSSMHEGCGSHSDTSHHRCRATSLHERGLGLCLLVQQLAVYIHA